MSSSTHLIWEFRIAILWKFSPILFVYFYYTSGIVTWLKPSPPFLVLNLKITSHFISLYACQYLGTEITCAKRMDSQPILV